MAGHWHAAAPKDRRARPWQRYTNAAPPTSFSFLPAGTLMGDLLRATRSFASFRSALAGEGGGVVLVETSQRMRLLQAKMLLGDCGVSGAECDGAGGNASIPPVAARLVGRDGVSMTWVTSVDAVTSQQSSSASSSSSSSSSSPPPPPPTLFIANEFFDALPVHQLVHNGKGTYPHHTSI